MAPKTKLIVVTIFCALTTLISRNCNAQTTVRPYQFGFTIEEQQHRYEKRDERGIVMGEFGFITADGIYHVTVYATDEEGRFRILAMKNYPYESPPKTIDMMIVQKKTIAKAAKTPPPTILTTTLRPKFNYGQQACSGCFVPNKNQNSDDQQKKRKNEIRPLSKTIGGAKNPSTLNTIPGSNRKVPNIIANIAMAATNTIILQSNTNKHIKNTQKIDKNRQIGINNLQIYHNTQSKTNSRSAEKQKTGLAPPSPPAVYTPKTQTKPFSTKSGGKVATVPPSITTNTAKLDARAPSLNKPSTVSTKASLPGPLGSASPTLPANGNNNDSGDLYRFKYILDYNGHTETGSRNGNKQGSFYSIGDDNIERTIEYIANEFGFQPRVRWRKVNPNEIKSKENTLKDYEFVWFKQP